MRSWAWGLAQYTSIRAQLERNVQKLEPIVTRHLEKTCAQLALSSQYRQILKSHGYVRGDPFAKIPIFFDYIDFQTCPVLFISLRYHLGREYRSAL